MVDSPGRGPLNILTFTTACIVGGSVTGLALAVLGGLVPASPPPGPAIAGVIVLSCVALLRDLGVVRFWMPENRRQVRQAVLRHPPTQKNAKKESAKIVAPNPSTEGPTPAATTPRFRTRSAIPLKDGVLRT